MSAEKAKTHDERLSARLQKARLALTEQELQFFPKANSMPDQPRSQWAPNERQIAALADLSLDLDQEGPYGPRKRLAFSNETL